jgi:hypothetical protein
MPSTAERRIVCEGTADRKCGFGGGALARLSLWGAYLVGGSCRERGLSWMGRGGIGLEGSGRRYN